MILTYLLLPVFFFIGLVTAYEDIRRGKIRNKWIVLGAIWALSIYFFFLIWNFFQFGGPIGEISISFLWKSFLNGFTALCVAYLIWRFEGWSAGDAKLFFVFSLLIPISYYSKSYLPVFPSFALLVNIFIPILLFLIFASCFYLLRLKAYRFKILKLLVAGEKNWLGLFRKLIHFYVGREEKEGRGEFYQCLFEWLNQPPLWAKKNHPKKNLCEYANQFSFLDFIIFILFFQGLKSPPV